MLPGDHQSFVRRAVVEQCANGDYQRADRFEIYLDGEYNQAEVLYFVCRHFVGAVARLPPRVYPRSRWTGALATLTCPLGLLMNMNSLFQETFVLYAQTYNVTSSVDRVRGDDEVLAIEGQPVNDEVGGNEAVDVDPMLAMRELRNSYLRSGLRFCADPVAPAIMLVMVKVTRPQQDFMVSAIELAGANWDKEQDALVAFAAASQGQRRLRRYRVQEVHDTVQEKAYVGEIAHLSRDAREWEDLGRCMKVYRTQLYDVWAARRSRC